MSTTASLVLIKDGIRVAAIHKSADGYVFGGLGDDLVTILSETKFVDAECLFASIVAGLKKGMGGIYLCHPDRVARMNEDYIYELDVNNKGKEVILKVISLYDYRTSDPSPIYNILFKQVN
jgi:hypothetical protein